MQPGSASLNPATGADITYLATGDRLQKTEQDAGADETLPSELVEKRTGVVVPDLDELATGRF